MPRIFIVRREAGRGPLQPHRLGSLEPLDIDEKDWSLCDYFELTASLAIQPQAYFLGLLALTLGLSWMWLGVGAFASSLIVAGLVVVSGHGPAKYGIPLVVATRTSFGIYGSRLFGLLFLVAAVPWAALMVSVAAEGVTRGILSVDPSFDQWNPLPWDLRLPAGLPFFRLCVLGGICLVMLLWLLVPSDMAVGMRRSSRLAFSLAGGVFISACVWAYTGIGFGDSVQAYNTLRVPGDNSLYVNLALFIVTGVSCWAPLALGFADFARYAYRRAVPMRAFVVCFPILSTVTAMGGACLVGSVYQASGADIVTSSPLALIPWLSPEKALPLGLAFAIVAIHVCLAGFGVAAANCIADFAPRKLNARAGGALFVLGSVALSASNGIIPAYSLPSAYWPVDPLRVSTAPFSFFRWSRIAGGICGGLFAVLVADYHAIRRRRLPTDYLYRTRPLLHKCGVNGAVIIALTLAYGVTALGAFILSQSRVTNFLVDEAPFSGFAVAFCVGLVSYSILFKAFQGGPSSPRVMQSDSPVHTAAVAPPMEAVGPHEAPASSRSSRLAQELATQLHALLNHGASAPSPPETSRSAYAQRSRVDDGDSRSRLYPRLPPSAIEDTKEERVPYAMAVPIH